MLLRNMSHDNLLIHHSPGFLSFLFASRIQKHVFMTRGERDHCFVSFWYWRFLMKSSFHFSTGAQITHDAKGSGYGRHQSPPRRRGAMETSPRPNKSQSELSIMIFIAWNDAVMSFGVCTVAIGPADKCPRPIESQSQLSVIFFFVFVRYIGGWQPTSRCFTAIYCLLIKQRSWSVLQPATRWRSGGFGFTSGKMSYLQSSLVYTWGK